MSQSIEQVLLNIAVNLNAHQPTYQHYQKLLDALQQVLPCDASALFILDDAQNLVPVAINGLSMAVLGRKFAPHENPRLEMIMQSRLPVRFPENSSLPDPFDGLLSEDDEGSIDVHSCMGCSLYVEEALVGVLTIDALASGAFKKVTDETIATFAALAAGIVRNISLFDALEKANHQQRSINQLLIDEARDKGGKLVGVSPQIVQLRNSIKMVAQSNYAVLISGETGTGKELVAHEVHAQSRRSDKPMVYVNCAALPESIAESELFGHVKGAFTGANSNRAGKFELADGGTIFLDEIGELPILLQAKLLRVIQQGEVQRVGADHNTFIDVRIIAATNRDLHKEVEEQRFRSDLFHRLNVFPIHVPPLREREGDIAVLVGHILDRIRSQFQIKTLHLHPRALTLLEKQPWLGNVRELEHSLMRAGLHAVQDQDELIKPQHFTSEFVDIPKRQHSSQSSLMMPNEPIALRQAVETYQKQLIEHALKKNDGVWAKAAKFLQVDRGNLYKLGKKLGL